MVMMQVLKRNGELEEVSFDKVLNRIRNISDNLDVNAFEVAQKVCSRIYNGVKTSELDELAAQLCSSMTLDHPDYGTLASRIIISNHHKNTSPSFSETVQILYDNTDDHGNSNPLVSRELYETVMRNKEKLNIYIDYTRDYAFDYFGFMTLEKAYLMKSRGKVVERPQHMFMRVAIGIHGTDVKDALQTYDMMSKKYFIHATPTLFNAGTPRPQCSSCFVLSASDSIEGIFDTLKECALISKYAGGIGLNIHDIRARNSIIRGTNGTSTGIVPMLRVFNNTARYVNQSGRRNGSIAVYIEPWHADVQQFLDMRKNHGLEEERARDLFYALWIPDLFMKRVKEDGVWSLMCPDMCRGLSDTYGDEFEVLYEKYEKEGKFVRQMKAQDLWFKILESQIETGTPFMLYKDHINRKNNQKNVGIIKSSNLCVAPETPVLTDKGYFPIASLAGEHVRVWNGARFSDTVVCKTNDSSKLIRVTFDNGMQIDCTMYHKFYVKDTNVQDSCIKEAIRMKEARELCLGDVLEEFSLPVVRGPYRDAWSAKNEAYTRGYFFGAGAFGTKNVYISVGGKHIRVLDRIIYDTCEVDEKSGALCVHIEPRLANKGLVPLNMSLGTRLRWLEGVLDSQTGYTPKNSIVCASIDVMRTILLMLQTMGVNTKVQGYGHNVYKITLTSIQLWHLKALGFSPLLLQLPKQKPHINPMDNGRLKVVGLKDNNRTDATYCFNEHERHRGVFNGIITGQCTEIMEFTSPEEHAVCNLASICLPTYVESGEFDFNALHAATKIIVKNLNKVIDINFYPVEKAKHSNEKHRPIGIGVQGLADTFVLLRMPFESLEARRLNLDIFETIYHAAVEASMELAKKHGKTYTSFEGSPTSQGVLQFDLWGVNPSPRYDWNTLKKDVKEHGLLNSLLVAPMPTASTSQIMGFNEAFEPFTSNIYKRKTLAGEFILVNKYLIKDLQDLGLWNSNIKNKIILNEGSVQDIPEIPQKIKELYKIAWEIKQKVVIDMAADRGAFIDQSQSMNVFMPDPSFQKLSSLHFYAWNAGLKTGMYYLRTRAKAKAQQFTMDMNLCKFTNIKDHVQPSNESDVCEACSA